MVRSFLLRHFGLALVPALATMLVAQAAAQDQDAESKTAAVRAALLFKIASYLTIDPDSPAAGKPRKEYRIGLLGDDKTTAMAQRMLPGKKVGDATVVIVTISTADALAGRAAEQCDLLFIATPIEDATLAKVLTLHAQKPMAMLCHRPGFAADGGTIQLFVQDSGIRFEVNCQALRRQHLKASPQLLKHSQTGPVR